MSAVLREIFWWVVALAVGVVGGLLLAWGVMHAPLVTVLVLIALFVAAIVKDVRSER